MKEKKPKKNPHAVALGRLGGKVGGNARAAALTDAEKSKIGRMGGRVGGKARAEALTPKRRSEIARKAGLARAAQRKAEADQ
jgi:general stress protein YciG